MMYNPGSRHLLLIFVCSVLLISCGEENNNDTTKEKDTVNVPAGSSAMVEKSAVRRPFFDDGGTGGIPVVFVHSFGGSTRHWDAQLAHLRKNRRAIALDLRGHGQSPAPAGNDYSIEAFASDIEAVIDSLQLSKFVLVGHSLGGAAAIAYTGKHPDKVAGLVLEGTPGKTPPDQSKGIIESLESDKYDTVMTAYMTRLLKNASHATDSLESTGMKKLSKEVTLSIIKATFGFDPVPSLQKYPGQVLIINTPSENQPGALQTFFPKIPHKVVPGTSHWIHIDKPGIFNALLDDYLKKIN